jgi:hypothetical protein
MNVELLIVIMGVFGSAIAAFVTWKVAKRNTSGTIDTSEAASLWTESTTIRNELRVEIIGLREQLKEATRSISDLMAQIRAGNEATAAAREETRLSRAETATLRLEVAAVHDEVRTNNSQTMGALADNQETRRIAGIPEGDRTETERGHIEKVGIRDDG